MGPGNLRSQPTLHSGLKTQAEEPYCRGRMMKAPKRPKDVAEDNLMLNTSQNTWRKGQTQYRGSTREKAANTIVWSPTSDRPILQTMLFNFSQPPPTTLMYGLIGQVNTPKKQNLHVDTKREVNTGIKGKESKGGEDPPKKEDKILQKGRMWRIWCSSDEVRELKPSKLHRCKA